MTSTEKPITNIIREVFLNNVTRMGIIDEIQEKLFVNRSKAKQLFYSFLYYAEEKHLEDILIRA